MGNVFGESMTGKLTLSEEKNKRKLFFYLLKKKIVVIIIDCFGFQEKEM